MPDDLRTDEPKLTLNWFFAEASESPADALEVIKDKLDDIENVEWKTLSNEVLAQLDQLLDIDLGKLIFSAWERYRLLRKYCDKEAYPPEETAFVPLAEHKIQSTHRPFVEIMINDTPVGRLDFDIRLTLDLEGLELKVRDGKVMAITAGSCRGSGTLKCGDVLLKEQKTREFALPGSIDFGEGWEIPAL